MTGGMQDGCDDNQVFVLTQFVNDPVGKTIRIAPADVFDWLPATTKQRVLGKPVSDLDHLLDKRRAQTRLLRFLPRGGLGHIFLHLRPELDPPLHLAKRERSRSFMVSSESAESGFRRCSSSRCATNSSSAGDMPGSSKSSA